MLRYRLSQLLTKLGFESRIARNSIVLGGAEILVRVLNLFLTIILFRYLKPEGAGVYKFVVNFGILFAVVAEGGISRPAVRALARAGSTQVPKFFGLLVVARLFLCALSILLLFVVFALPLEAYLDQELKILVGLWMFAIFAQAYRRNAEVIFQATQQLGTHSCFMVLNRLVALCGVLMAMAFRGGLTWILAAYVIADVVDALASLVFIIRKYDRPRWPTSPREVVALMREGVPFAVSLICQQLRYYLDAVLLKFLFRGAQRSTEEEIGLYSSAASFVTTFLFLPNTLCASVFPELARCYKSDPKRYGSLAARLVNLLLFIGLSLSVFFSLFPYMLVFLYGQRYSEAVDMLGIIVWAIPFVFLTVGLSAVFAAADRQGLFTFVSGLATVFKLAGSMILLPEKGGLGAATVFVLAELFAACTLIIIITTTERNVVDWLGIVLIALFHCLVGIAFYGAVIPHTTGNVLAAGAYFVTVGCGFWLLLKKRQQLRE